MDKVAEAAVGAFAQKVSARVAHYIASELPDVTESSRQSIRSCVYNEIVWVDNLRATLAQDKAQRTPCGRSSCGETLLCCRPDCPLVTVEVETGLTRIMTRSAFVEACRGIVKEPR